MGHNPVNADRRAKNGRRRRPLDAARLERAALAYVERYGGPSASLARVLARRIERADIEDDEERRILEAAANDIVRRLVDAGLVNDDAFARDRARTLARRGRSTLSIRSHLVRRGLPAGTIETALDAAVDGPRSHDLRAAVQQARRKGLGPFRDPASREARRTRDVAALVRAGFPPPLARRVIGTDDPEALAAEAGHGDD